MSTESFLKQRAVNVAAVGHYTPPNWYDPQGKLRTFACRITRVSPYRMMVDVPVVGKIGDYLTSYFRDCGVAVSAQWQPPIGTPLAIAACIGRVVRLFPSGFAVKFIEKQNQHDLNRLIARPVSPSFVGAVKAASDLEDADAALALNG